MINKFQKGGKKDVVMQFVEGLAKTLQADPKEVVQIAQQNPDALESAVKAYQETQDMQQAAQAFTQVIQQKTQKAAHGAKLQYFKSLKHQCADDEELIYFKKGGSVDCGCVKKKMEEGGQAPKKSPVDKFKNKKVQDQATKDSIAVNVHGNQDIEINKPGDYKKNKQGKVQWTPDRTKAPYKKEKGGNLKKDCGGSTLKLKKKGGEVCPKCGKVHAAGMGCAVAKFKYRKLGGLL